GKTRRAFIWTYGTPRGEVLYDFTPGRAADGPMRYLEDFQGFVQADAYQGYNALFRSGRVVHIGCWAHARRKFFEARGEAPEFAEIVLCAIQRLYRIEREAKEKDITGQSLVEIRRRESIPILEGLKGLLETKRRGTLPQSGMGMAIDYALGQWESLLRY